MREWKAPLVPSKCPGYDGATRAQLSSAEVFLLPPSPLEPVVRAALRAVPEAVARRVWAFADSWPRTPDERSGEGGAAN